MGALNLELFKFKKSDIRYFTSALLIVSVFFSLFTALGQVVADTAGVTLSVTVQTSLTFSVPDTAQAAFGNLTPGTAKFATSTLVVTTNDTAGYVISLSGDNKTDTANNLQLGGSSATQITDQLEWIPGAATTTAGNAVLQSALDNSGNVLAFRVMSASSTNGTSFLSTDWWGAGDVTANALWAGIASTSPQRTIGFAGAGSYSVDSHRNSVEYFLNVAASQPTGAYSAPITFTATGL